MKKITIVLLIFASAFSSAFAQNLEHKIPANAQVVGSVKMNKFLELLSAQEFNSSSTGKKILKEIFSETKDPFNDIEKLGVDLNGSMYWYTQNTDSIRNYCFLIPIKNVDAFDKLFSTRFASFEEPFKINRNGTIRTVYQHDSNALFMWNEEMCLFIDGDYQYDFFEDSTVAARYGIKDYIPTDEVSTTISEEPAIDSTIALPPPPPDVIEIQNIKTKKKASSKKSTTAKTKNKKALPKVKKTVDYSEVEVVPYVEAPQENKKSRWDSIYEERDRIYQENSRIKKELGKKWVLTTAQDIFSVTPKNSIEQNESYKLSKDPAAIASLWFGDNFSYTNFLFGRYKSYLSGPSPFYSNFSGNLYMEKNRARFTGSTKLSDENAEMYKAIYDHKLNKKLLQYINEDSIVGYMALAMNSKALLDYYPKIIVNTYGSLYPKYKDEISLGMDFLALALDEEALSKIFTGDAIFVFSGLTQKKSTYKTYKYDENYNSIEVEKEQTESLPDFLLMATTKDPSFLQKLIAYGIKHKKVFEAKDNVYKIESSGSPMPLYFLIKDEIVFLGTSYPEMQSIATNSYRPNVSDKLKEQLKSTYSAYFNPKKLSLQLQDSTYESKKYRDILSKTGNVYMTSFDIKNNTVSGEMVMDNPDASKNSLQYLFFLMDEMIKKEDSPEEE